MLKNYAVVLALFLVPLSVAGAQAQRACFTPESDITFGVEISIDYPAEVIGHDFARETVEDYLQDVQSGFMESYNNLEPLTIERELGCPSPPWVLDVDYETVTRQDDLLNVTFIEYSYVGGAHGFTQFHTFIFDLENERVVTLDDLFAPGSAPLGAIAELVIADVTVQRGSPPPEQGTNPTAANYEDYILTDDALVFFFEPYQMGAYAEGTFEVAIPLAALADELAPDFAP